MKLIATTIATFGILGLSYSAIDLMPGWLLNLLACIVLASTLVGLYYILRAWERRG